MNHPLRAATVLRAALIAVAVLAPLTAASAQYLSFSLTAVGAATPGTTVQYFGTFTNLLPSDNLFLTDSILQGNILKSPALTVDESPFLSNLPKFLTEDTVDNPGEYYLTPGQKVMFEVFGVTVAANAKPGTMANGMVDISGGGPGSSEYLTKPSVPFTTTVTNAVTVPEAGTPALALSLLGALGAAVVVRRKAVAR